MIVIDDLSDVDNEKYFGINSSNLAVHVVFSVDKTDELVW